MMQPQIFHSVTIAVFFFGCVTASVGSAEERNWNPWRKSAWSRDSSPIYTNIASSIASSEEKSWLPKWQSPKMPWSQNQPPRSYQPKTSTWNQMSKTSKRWWNKTIALLDPYPEPKSPKYSPTAGKAPKPNWFTGMFQPKESKKSLTLLEFLGLDRPK
jgi:hypothetical protein